MWISNFCAVYPAASSAAPPKIWIKWSDNGQKRIQEDKMNKRICSIKPWQHEHPSVTFVSRIARVREKQHSKQPGIKSSYIADDPPSPQRVFLALDNLFQP
jgi:hypothetical protein